MYIARQLSSELTAATGIVVSRQTVYKILHENACMLEHQGYVLYCLHNKREIVVIGA